MTSVLGNADVNLTMYGFEQCCWDDARFENLIGDDDRVSNDVVNWLNEAKNR